MRCSKCGRARHTDIVDAASHHDWSGVARILNRPHNSIPRLPPGATSTIRYAASSMGTFTIPDDWYPVGWLALSYAWKPASIAS